MNGNEFDWDVDRLITVSGEFQPGSVVSVVGEAVYVSFPGVVSNSLRIQCPYIL